MSPSYITKISQTTHIYLILYFPDYWEFSACFFLVFKNTHMSCPMAGFALLMPLCWVPASPTGIHPWLLSLLSSWNTYCCGSPKVVTFKMWQKYCFLSNCHRWQRTSHFCIRNEEIPFLPVAFYHFCTSLEKHHLCAKNYSCLKGSSCFFGFPITIQSRTSNSILWLYLSDNTLDSHPLLPPPSVLHAYHKSYHSVCLLVEN